MAMTVTNNLNTYATGSTYATGNAKQAAESKKLMRRQRRLKRGRIPYDIRYNKTPLRYILYN